ncbi:MAG: pyrroline-5-carboxylate reductase family protein, partial [bacterium]
MNSQNQTIVAFIGGGNMSSSIIGGLIGSGWPGDNFRVSDPQDAQRDKLQGRFAVRCFKDNNDCVEDADVVVLSVKPQMLKHAVESIGPSITARTPLLISIAAGINSASIANWIGREIPIVRVMPNTPALVNCGVSGLFAGSLATTDQKKLAEQLMRAVGEVIWVEHEDLIDTVTGVSGSGP